ncbi:g483 [Coccomyxa elongata]
MAAKNARRDFPHQAPSARVMSDKLAEHLLELCRSAPKGPQEGIEVISPRRALAPDELTEPLRTSSDCSRVDRRADGQDWRQEMMDLVQAEVDGHVLHYKRIIAAKTRKIGDLKRQLASIKKQLG